MKYIIIFIFSIFIFGCATTKKFPIYDIEFGIIDFPKSYPLTINNHTTIIPWLRGELEPYFVAHVSSRGKNRFELHYKIFKHAETGDPILLEESKCWNVEGGEGNGGFLTVDLKKEYIYGKDVYGKYYFSIYAGISDKPTGVIPFTIVRGS